MAVEWTATFVAVSVFLGEPLGEALACVGLEEETALVRALRSDRRETRAQAMAAALEQVVAALPQWEAE